MKIFFEILVVWQENDLVFSSNSKKKALQKQHKKAPFSLYTHTDNKIQHDKVSISWPHGKGTQIFYKTIKSCVIIDCQRLMFCLYSLRYTCVFKIHVRTYFKQSVLTDQIHLQQFETLIFHDMATIRLQVYNFGVESFTDG